MTCNIFQTELKHKHLLEDLMKNESLVEFIKEKYYEQKMSAEYELQLTKIIELEKKIHQRFFKGQMA